ncbi:MAG: UDP-N-acetylmuramoyl-L-alanine--D-glutamate ligase [Steroidobacteraceae bacterium]
MVARKTHHAEHVAPALTGKTVIAGLGRTGLSCVRFLKTSGVDFTVTDSRVSPPGLEVVQSLLPEQAIRVGQFDLALLDGAVEIIASPGISLREPLFVEAVRRGIPVVGDIELFARAAKAPIVAVTGTNGKSTVTTLVALMTQATGRTALAGGNLGPPALELLDQPVPDCYVLELSSYQLETTMSLVTTAAAVLNVTPDHMDRYDSLADYAAAKARVLAGAGAAVINQDDPIVRAMPKAGQRILGFSLEAPADFSLGDKARDPVLLRFGKPLVAMSELKIAGLHNAANALAAFAMLEAMNLPFEPAIEALMQFRGLPHRSQWVADVAGVRYVDDSKGTNVGATLAAVAGMPGSLVVIAGGQGKGQDFSPLQRAFHNKVRHAVLMGQDAAQLAAALDGICTIEFARDMDEAVVKSANAARSGESVLLSPACASLDMFRDYGHRGDAFAAAVRRLAP